MHPHTKAVGFTGSFAGGKQLYDWAQERDEPIPVFSEMGSVNPVFLFPEKLKADAVVLAEQLAGSVTLGAGQFCTNPGLVIGVDGPEMDAFIAELGARISGIAPAKMLHAGISKAYTANRSLALEQHEVSVVAVSAVEPSSELDGVPTLATASGAAFLANPVLHQEVFGPYSIVIRCRDAAEMQAVASRLEGQLTCSLMATETDVLQHSALVELISLLCGRMVMNGVPTGVEVCWGMQHGGPFPATTDARFGSVGPDAIRRFVRPLCFQNFPASLLPEELRDENPLGIPRILS
jgi:NADP-dependent aldehyde dehydrogenase